MKKSRLLKLLGVAKLPLFDTDPPISDEDMEILAARALEDWKKEERMPVSESFDQTVQELIKACESELTLALYYQAGSTPGQLRKFSPQCVFRTSSGQLTYVTGFCHLRNDTRTFRTERISLA